MSAGPTWSKDVAPLIASRCAHCHSEKGSAPFILTDYAAGKRYAAAIDRAVTTRAMPPWPADLSCTSVSGASERTLTSPEIDLVHAWVGAGAPEGESGVRAEPTPSPAVDVATQTVALPKYLAEGHSFHSAKDAYCYKVRLPFATRRYVTGFELASNNPRFVHGATIYTPSPAIADTLADEYPCPSGPGFAVSTPVAFGPVAVVGSWQAGQGAVRFPADTAITIEGNATWVVRVRYHPTSGSTDNETSLKIVSQETPVAHPLRVLGLPVVPREIPARTLKFSAQAKLTPPSNGSIHGVLPFLGETGLSAAVSIDNQCAMQVRWDSGVTPAYWYEGGPRKLTSTSDVAMTCDWSNPGDAPITSDSESSADCLVAAYWTD